MIKFSIFFFFLCDYNYLVTYFVRWMNAKTHFFYYILRRNSIGAAVTASFCNGYLAKRTLWIPIRVMMARYRTITFVLTGKRIKESINVNKSCSLCLRLSLIMKRVLFYIAETCTVKKIKIKQSCKESSGVAKGGGFKGSPPWEGKI
jgi:hypothetical protein